LLALLDELAASPWDDWIPMARLAAELALRVDTDEMQDPALERALRAVRDDERRGWTIWELANAELVAGRPGAAEACARFGLEAHGLAGSRYAPRLWHVRAESARRLGQWERAQEFLEHMAGSLDAPRGTAALAQAEYHENRSHLLQARAQILLELGLLDRCGELAAEAIDHAKKSGRGSALAAALLFSSDRELMRGDAAAAIEVARAGAADEALAPWRAVFELVEGLAWVEMVRRGVETEDERVTAAASARAAFDAALAHGLARGEWLKLELGRCDLELCLGQGDAARAPLERARTLAEESGSGDSREEILLTVLAWRLAQEAGAEPAELAARRAELFGAYDALLAQWEATPRRPGGIGFLHLAWRTQVLNEVLQAKLGSEPDEADVESAFECVLLAQGMGTLARERGLSRPETSELRARLLAPKRGLLVLVPARDGTHLFALDSKGIEHYPIPFGRSELKREAGGITSVLMRPEGALDAQRITRLSDQLLPAQARARIAGWNAAITVGFDLLSDLPFGILCDAERRPYASRLALVTLPSLALGVELSARKTGADGAAQDLVLVVAADPAQELELASLRFGKLERERLLKPFAGERVTLLEGAGASLGGVRQAAHALERARVVHFLAHGTTLVEREYSAALVLSGTAPVEQRLLTAEDVAGLRFDGLVVLSACGSGRGPPRTGDDCLVNLGGAFLRAGARCVVLARFPVEYEATLAFMERLHERLAAGLSPAEAALAARAASGEPDALAAYRLASFEVLGLGFEPVFPRSD